MSAWWNSKQMHAHTYAVVRRNYYFTFIYWNTYAWWPLVCNSVSSVYTRIANQKKTNTHEHFVWINQNEREHQRTINGNEHEIDHCCHLDSTNCNTKWTHSKYLFCIKSHFYYWLDPIWKDFYTIFTFYSTTNLIFFTTKWNLWYKKTPVNSVWKIILDSAIKILFVIVSNILV